MAMSFLSMWEAKLPPGFRFHPRDEELITDYLAKKITGEPNSSCPMMEVVDLNKVEPWELPETARVGEEWYFFTTRDKKYATGHRTNRATSSGYWKATGKDRQVTDGRRGGREVGMRKTLVFYQGRAPKGKKTDWVMHEFRAEVDLSGDHRLFPPPPTSSSSSKDDWVLCRVFYKRRDLSPKPTNSMEENNFYNGEASCSLPPLLDTHINFDQHNQPLINNNNDNNLQGYKIEQVPCFSNLRFHPPPALPTPTSESKISLSSSCPSSLPQLGTAHLPNMSSFLTNIFDGH